MNGVWTLVSSHYLVYGGQWDDIKQTIKAKTFEKMLGLAKERVNHYQSDLWHDALWINEYITGACSFDWVARESGTFIGMSASQCKLEDWEKAVLYRLEIVENVDRWTLYIYEAVTENKETVTITQEPNTTSFSTLGNKETGNKETKKKVKMDEILNSLREKLDEANSTKETLEEHQSELEDAVNDLDNFIEEYERLIESLETLPEVSVYVNLDTVSFEA